MLFMAGAAKPLVELPESAGPLLLVLFTVLVRISILVIIALTRRKVGDLDYGWSCSSVG
jgi:hypothetical protein